MSVLVMTAEQRAELETVQRQSRNVRHWKRSQAVLLRADATPVAVVARTLGCSRVSMSHWTTAWQEAGVAANRCAASMDALAQQAVAWLDAPLARRPLTLLRPAQSKVSVASDLDLIRKIKVQQRHDA